MTRRALSHKTCGVEEEVFHGIGDIEVHSFNGQQDILRHLNIKHCVVQVKDAQRLARCDFFFKGLQQIEQLCEAYVLVLRALTPWR